jgi:hypothetical protein
MKALTFDDFDDTDEPSSSIHEELMAAVRWLMNLNESEEEED